MAPRDEVVDYTLPVFPRITLTLWQPLVNRAPLNYTAFIDVFPMNVWMLIGLTFLVIAVVFYIIDKSGSNQFHEAIHSEGFGFLNSVALSAILLIQLSYPVMVKSLSARIIYLVGCLGAYMLFFLLPMRSHCANDNRRRERRTEELSGWQFNRLDIFP